MVPKTIAVKKLERKPIASLTSRRINMESSIQRGNGWEFSKTYKRCKT